MKNEQAVKRFFVSGTVQGVGYRYFAQRVAVRLGIAGYAKNLRDGRVEIYAAGSPQALEDLRAELQRGPGAASVVGVTEQDAELDASFGHNFSIEYEQ